MAVKYFKKTILFSFIVSLGLLSGCDNGKSGRVEQNGGETRIDTAPPIIDSGIFDRDFYVKGFYMYQECAGVKIEKNASGMITIDFAVCNGEENSGDIFTPKSLAGFWAGAYGYGFSGAWLIVGGEMEIIGEGAWGHPQGIDATLAQYGALLRELNPRRVDFPGLSRDKIEVVRIGRFNRQSRPEKLDEYGHLIHTAGIRLKKIQECIIRSGNANKFVWSNFTIKPEFSLPDDAPPAMFHEAAKAIICNKVTDDWTQWK